MTPARSTDGSKACGSEVPGVSHCERCPHNRHDFCGALVRSLEKLENGQSRGCRDRRTVNPGEQIAGCGEVSRHIFVLCRGWGYRYFVLSNGRRQILSFLLPGDLFSAASIFEDRFSFSVDALTEADITGFRRTEVKRQLAASPGLWTRWAESVSRQVGAADELLVALGQRTAEERVAYLVLHLTRRMQALGLAGDDRYRFPLKQTHIADALGVTPECVCRTLSRFRKRGILALSGGYLEILDFAELGRIGSPRGGPG